MSVEQLFKRVRERQAPCPRSCSAQAAASARLARLVPRAEKPLAEGPPHTRRPRLSAQALDKLAAPTRRRRKAPSLVEARSDLEVQMQRAAEMPGPDYFCPPGMGDQSGGRPTFAKDTKGSALDELISRQSQIPGPGEYGGIHPDSMSAGSGASAGTVKWSSPSSRCARPDSVPGPGAYSTVQLWPLDLPGGRFSSGHAKSDVELLMLKSSQLPSPDAYQLPTAKIRGCPRWNKHPAASELDELVSRASAIPGPGAYNLQGSKAVPGGLLQGKTKSDLDFLLLRAKELPSPADTAAPPPPTKGVRVYRPKRALCVAL